jgi:hypothetical protein
MGCSEHDRKWAAIDAEFEEEPLPGCPHGCGPLRWVEDAFFCPACRDEFAYEEGS